MITNIAETLDHQIHAAGVEIVGVSIGNPVNKSTWTVQPSTLQSAAQPTIDAFDIPAEETAWQWYAVRTQRDQSLTISDWTQGNDTPLDASDVTTWGTYRETLRNIPQDQSDPYAIEWPTPPFIINPPPS
jgi:hypothetical protein